MTAARRRGRRMPPDPHRAAHQRGSYVYRYPCTGIPAFYDLPGGLRNAARCCFRRDSGPECRYRHHTKNPDLLIALYLLLLFRLLLLFHETSLLSISFFFAKIKFILQPLIAVPPLMLPPTLRLASLLPGSLIARPIKPPQKTASYIHQSP